MSHALLRLRRAEPTLAPRRAAIGFRLRTWESDFAAIECGINTTIVEVSRRESIMQKYKIDVDGASITIHLYRPAPVRMPTQMGIINLQFASTYHSIQCPSHQAPSSLYPTFSALRSTHILHEPPQHQPAQTRNLGLDIRSRSILKLPHHIRNKDLADRFIRFYERVPQNR